MNAVTPLSRTIPALLAAIAVLSLGCGSAGQSPTSGGPASDGPPPIAESDAAPSSTPDAAITVEAATPDAAANTTADAAADPSTPDVAATDAGATDARAVDAAAVADAGSAAVDAAAPTDQSPTLPAPLTGEEVPQRTCGVIGLGRINSIVYLPDGSGYIAGSAAGIAKLFRASDDAELRLFDGQHSPVNVVAVSANGALLVTGADDGTARIWRVSDGQSLHVLSGHTHPVVAAAISRDGARVATGAKDGEIRLWSATTGASSGTIKQDTRITSLVFLADGTLLGATADGSVDLWSATGAHLRQVLSPGYAIWSLALAPDGDSFFVAGDRTARFRLSDGQLIADLHQNYTNWVLFSPDGSRLYTAQARDLLYATTLADGQRTLLGVSGTVSRAALALSPDGRTLLTNDTDDGMGIEVYEPLKPSPERPIRIITTGISWLEKLAFSPDSQHLVVGRDGLIELRHIPDGTLVRTFDIKPNGGAAQLAKVALSPDGHLLAAAQGDKAVVWDTASGDEVRELRGPTQFGTLTFLPDGKSLLLGGDPGFAEVHALSDDALVGKLDGLVGWVYGSAASPDGRLLAVGADNNTGLVVFGASDRARRFAVPTAQTPWSVEFSPDSRHIAVANWEGVLVLSAQDGAVEQNLPVISPGISEVAFSRSGALVAAAATDHDVRLWRVSDGKPAASLSGHVERTKGLAFSPDGRFLATGGDDGTIRLWCK